MPRELDPVTAGAAMPLPLMRPNVEEILAKLEKNRVAGGKAPREQTADKTEKAPEKTPEKTPPGTGSDPKAKNEPQPDSKTERPRPKVRG